MFAVVTKNDYLKKRRYQAEVLGSVVHISVGEGYRRRALKEMLRPFEGRFIAARDLNLHGLKPFDTAELEERLLFHQFCKHQLSQPRIALSVGVFDPAGKYLDSPHLTEVVAHAASTTVLTFKNADEYCKRWLSDTGTCPEIVERKAWLFGCDSVFAPQGFSGFDGLLFGKGGRGIDTRQLLLSQQHKALLKYGVDPIELYCMLESEAEFTESERISQKA